MSLDRVDKKLAGVQAGKVVEEEPADLSFLTLTESEKPKKTGDEQQDLATTASLLRAQIRVLEHLKLLVTPQSLNRPETLRILKQLLFRWRIDSRLNPLAMDPVTFVMMPSLYQLIRLPQCQIRLMVDRNDQKTCLMSAGGFVVSLDSSEESKLVPCTLINNKLQQIEQAHPDQIASIVHTVFTEVQEALLHQHKQLAVEYKNKFNSVLPEDNNNDDLEPEAIPF